MEGINCLGFKEVVGGLVAKSYLTLVTPRPCSLQGPLSMGLSRQEYWSGLSFPPPGDLAYPGIKHASPTGGFFTSELPGKPNSLCPSPNFGSA